jgi:hypothetical protein
MDVRAAWICGAPPRDASDVILVKVGILNEKKSLRIDRGNNSRGSVAKSMN